MPRPPIVKPASMALLIVAAWLVVGGMTTTHVVLLQRIYGITIRQEPAETFIAIFAWALLTPFALFAAERLPARPRGAPAMAAVAVALSGCTVTILSSWMTGGMNLQMREILVVACSIFGSSFLFALFIVGLAVHGRVRRQALERRERAERLESQLAEARLRRLRADLQPHFLFNTLNALATLVHVDAHAADAAIGKLIELLRHSTEAAHRSMVPLREELDFAERYLDLHKVRFGERLRSSVEVSDPRLLDVAVPSLILQPIVENAVLHGLRQAGGGSIRVKVFAVQERLLCIAVHDDGPGCDPEAMAGRAGIGIPNTRARLEALYDRSDVLRFRSEGGEFITEIRVPLEAA
ncbi:MAG TPA: histidine kinase [Thermoanaerobaculia bacterium]|nr:histidine kinase [Thermoanaerobaculia bacterium]